MVSQPLTAQLADSRQMQELSFVMSPEGQELRGKLPKEECEKVLQKLRDPLNRQNFSIYFATQMYDFWVNEREPDEQPDPYFVSSSIALRTVRTYINATEIVETGSWPAYLSPPEFWWMQLEAMERCPLEYPSNAESATEYRARRNATLDEVQSELQERWGIDG